MSNKALRRILETHRALGPEVRQTTAAEMHEAIDELVAIAKAARAALRHISGEATITSSDLAVLRALTDLGPLDT